MNLLRNATISNVNASCPNTELGKFRSHDTSMHITIAILHIQLYKSTTVEVYYKKSRDSCVQISIVNASWSAVQIWYGVYPLCRLNRHSLQTCHTTGLWRVQVIEIIRLWLADRSRPPAYNGTLAIGYIYIYTEFTHRGPK